MPGRRRNPYPILVVAALVPVFVLGGCWRFADNRVPDPVDLDAVPDTSEGGGTTTPMTTPALSVRRAPAVLARDVNTSAFVEEVESFLPMVDSTSCVSVAVDGQPIAAKNADVPLRPASNVKLITGAVAQQVLGDDFTFVTRVRGDLQGGAVQGDLYLVGAGDPLLASEWWGGSNTKYPQFNETSIEALAQSIVDAGVTSVTGSVIGDASHFDDEWYPPSWGDDVRFTEGGPVSGLLVNDSREAIDRSSNDPVVGAATVLTEELVERGVTIGGAPGEGTAPGDMAELASVSSQPLRAILAEMLTTSDNNTAEMLLKELGVQAGGGGTREAGLAVVTATLTDWGIPMTGVELHDGSGLSDDNRMTCDALMAVVQHVSPTDSVGQGLAVAAQEGGTLSDAFVETELAGVLRGKTGTLYNYEDGVGGRPAAKTLSGFVPVDGGGAVEFVLLLNGPQIAEQVEYRPIWDAFGEVLATYPSGPTAAELGPR